MNLPKKIPIFPLSNFIIFPKATVPLNIFEPRYVDMVNEEFSRHKPKYSEVDIDNAISNGFKSLVVTSEDFVIDVYEKLFRQHFNEALNGI